MAATNFASISTITPHCKAVIPATTNTRATLLAEPSVGQTHRVNQILVANTDTATINATLEAYDGTTYNKVGNAIAVPANATLCIVERETLLYVLNSSDAAGEIRSLHATSSTGGSLTFTISYETIG